MLRKSGLRRMPSQHTLTPKTSKLSTSLVPILISKKFHLTERTLQLTFQTKKRTFLVKKGHQDFAAPEWS